jgi:ABC-type multidrug transport system fused ATPase/permease subunit
MSERTRFNQVIVTHLSEVKGSLFVAALCTLGLALTDLLRPWPLKIIFDNIILNKPLPGYLFFLKGLFEDGKVLSLVAVSVTIILISVLKSSSAYAQLHLTSRAGYKLAHAFRRDLFAHVQKLSISFFKRARTGELLTKMTSDTNNLRDLFTDFVLTFVSEFLALVGMMVIMLALNWKLSLIVFATLPPLVALSFYRFRMLRMSARRQRREEGKIASRISEILNSVMVVQAFGRERHEEERFESQSLLTLEESMRAARIEGGAARAVDIISGIGTWAVILFGSLEALQGRMTPGNVLIFASYMNSLYGPIRALAKLSAKLSRTVVSAQRIAEILAVEPEITDEPDAIEASNLKGEIVFDNVAFHYDGGRDVLQNISFKIEPGQHVALLGPSGSGKTTLSNLLLRFYDPARGRILIDGVDIKKFKRESIRREIGVVLQDSILFGATVKDNIAYGKLDATMAEIVAAAKAANAHDFIMELEDGYDTVIGERGGTLSGGQRQRIAIARSFIRDVGVLILDEPMTGLDVESEAAVRVALRRLMAGKTCLVITHDPQALAEADQTLIIGDGRAFVQGTHAGLREGATGTERFLS